MTREIKFRAWDKDNEFMVLSEKLMDADEYFFQFDNFGKIQLIQLQYTNIDDENKNAVVVNSHFMQYTGLKDKNGKEIYEGDIWEEKFEGGSDKGEVKWNSESAYFEITDGEDSMSDLVFLHHGEIIGNIYENPELLTNPN